MQHTQRHTCIWSRTNILMARNEKQNTYHFELNQEENGNQTNNVSGENALGDGNNRLLTFSFRHIFSGQDKTNAIEISAYR